MEEGEARAEGCEQGGAGAGFGEGATQRDVAGVCAVGIWGEEGADGGAGAVGGDEEIGLHGSFLAVVGFEMHGEFLAGFGEGGDFVAVEMGYCFVVLVFFGDAAVFALHAVDVGSEDVVDQVPAGHVLPHGFFVYDFAIFVEILPAGRTGGDVAVAFVIALEEGQGVAAGYYACTLVV